MQPMILAVHEGAWFDIFEGALGKLLLENQRLKLLVFDREQEVILQWIP